MPDEAKTEDNVERLLAHLQDDSLASRLVRAHRDSEDPAAAMQAVLTERLKQIKAELDEPSD